MGQAAFKEESSNISKIKLMNVLTIVFLSEKKKILSKTRNEFA
jgi:hypothetical protein